MKYLCSGWIGIKSIDVDIFDALQFRQDAGIRRLTMKNKSPEGVHVWLILIKAFHAIQKVALADLQESWLKESDFRVLELLLHKGPMPVNAIGPKVDLTPGSISVAVDRLHVRGLVSRVEDGEDRRIRMVDLTPEGRGLIESVFSRHAAFMEKVASVLSREERVRLEGLLKKIGRHAEVLGGGSR